MTVKQPVFTVSFPLILLMATLAFQTCAEAQERQAGVALTDEEVLRLVEVNAALKDQIQTARIRFKKLNYIGVTPEIPAATAVAFMETMEQMVNAGGFDALDKGLSRVLAVAKDTIHRDGVKWQDAELIEDGQRIRNRWSTGGVLQRDSAFDGEREIQFQSDSNQANVSTGRSNWFMIRSATLRNQVSLDLDSLKEANSEGLVKRLDKAGKVRINAKDGMSFTIIDQHTGLRTESVTYNNGQLYKLCKFLQNSEYPEGIVIPEINVTFHFRDGMVSGCEAYVVDEAQFNIKIQDADFSVPVPAETVVVRDKATPGRHTSKLALASANALADPKVFPDYGASTPPGWSSIAIFSVGVAAFLGGAALWRVAWKH